MLLYRHYDTLPIEAKGAVVAIGNFDGVHKGHQAVINEAGLIARDLGRPWAVLTFEPHPRKFFDPNQTSFRLTPFRAKTREIAALGVDILIVQRFNKAFSRLGAEVFVTDALVRGIGAKHVVSGYDFVFGHKRSGHCDLLLSMGAEQGFGFTAVNAVEDENAAVYSSTRVRDFLSEGDLGGAKDILSRDYEISGRVIHGERRGHSIGFPTANIRPGQAMCPKLGVYAVQAAIETDNEPVWQDGVANIGIRPTFGGNGIILEAHLFAFDDDLYGKRLRVRLIDFLRPEKKFDGIDELKAQIASDVAKAKEVLT